MTRMDARALSHHARADDVAVLLLRVAERFQVSPAEILGPSRQERFVKPRWLACAAFSHLGYSTTRIGEIINHDHSTVINALKRSALLLWVREMVGEVTKGIEPLCEVDGICPICETVFPRGQRRLKQGGGLQVYCSRRCGIKSYRMTPDGKRNHREIIKRYRERKRAANAEPAPA